MNEPRKSHGAIVSIRTMKSLLPLSVITLLSLTACTSQNAYNSLRYYQEQDCQRMEKTDRDDCMRRSGMSYDEYRQEMKKQEKKE